MKVKIFLFLIFSILFCFGEIMAIEEIRVTPLCDEEVGICYDNFGNIYEKSENEFNKITAIQAYEKWKQKQDINVWENQDYSNYNRDYPIYDDATGRRIGRYKIKREKINGHWYKVYMPIIDSPENYALIEYYNPYGPYQDYNYEDYATDEIPEDYTGTKRIRGIYHGYKDGRIVTVSTKAPDYADTITYKSEEKPWYKTTIGRITIGVATFYIIQKIIGTASMREDETYSLALEKFFTPEAKAKAPKKISVNPLITPFMTRPSGVNPFTGTIYKKEISGWTIWTICDWVEEILHSLYFKHPELVNRVSWRRTLDRYKKEYKENAFTDVSYDAIYNFLHSFKWLVGFDIYEVEPHGKIGAAICYDHLQRSPDGKGYDLDVRYFNPSRTNPKTIYFPNYVCEEYRGIIKSEFLEKPCIGKTIVTNGGTGTSGTVDPRCKSKAESMCGSSGVKSAEYVEKGFINPNAEGGYSPACRVYCNDGRMNSFIM